MIRRETIVSGKLIFRRVFGSSEKKREKTRSHRSNPTSAAVEKINRRNAERSLQVKLHANFGKGDIHAVLTYGGEAPSQEDARKELKNFLQRLRRHFRKEGRELKWIAATEYQNHRIHHHVVLPAMDSRLLDRLWTAGHVRPTYLDGSGDYRKLAAYLIKETDKTFREPGASSKQRYSCSRNLTIPPVKTETVSARELMQHPKPIKGYTVDEDSIYQGVNPVTGIPYMEYVMIATDPDPRLHIWPRGTRSKYREKYYDAVLHQIEPVQFEFNIMEQEEVDE